MPALRCCSCCRRQMLRSSGLVDCKRRKPSQLLLLFLFLLCWRWPPLLLLALLLVRWPRLARGTTDCEVVCTSLE